MQDKFKSWRDAWVSYQLKLKSSSHLFKKWVKEMDEVLSKTHTHNQTGTLTNQDSQLF